MFKVTDFKPYLSTDHLTAFYLTLFSIHLLFDLFKKKQKENILKTIIQIFKGSQNKCMVFQLKQISLFLCDTFPSL